MKSIFNHDLKYFDFTSSPSLVIIIILVAIILEQPLQEFVLSDKQQ